TLRFTRWLVPTARANPYWLALGPDGRVWFTEFGAGKVGVLDPATGRISEYPVPGHRNPAGIAVDPHGVVWSATMQGCLLRLDPRTGRTRCFRIPEADDYGVATANDGTVWVGSLSGRGVYAFDPGSGRFRRHNLAVGGGPWWPVVGQHGQVWVTLAADRGNGLAELASGASGGGN
ncbi:MAG: virginiamycin B lyase family protein, partial [Sciscionella sp.]